MVPTCFAALRAMAGNDIAQRTVHLICHCAAQAASGFNFGHELRSAVVKICYIAVTYITSGSKSECVVFKRTAQMRPDGRAQIIFLGLLVAVVQFIAHRIKYSLRPQEDARKRDQYALRYCAKIGQLRRKIAYLTQPKTGFKITLNTIKQQ